MAKRTHRWTLGSYSRFISTAMKRESLTLPQARQFYRELRSEYERPMFAADLRKPVIRGIGHDIAQSIITSPVPTVSVSGIPSGFEDAEDFSFAIDASGIDLDDWQRYYDDFEEYDDPEEFEGTADYGEKE